MEHYKKALEQIANPVKFLTEEAEKQGNKINGAAAVAISNDPIWLREIARNALMYQAAKEDKATEDKKAPVDEDVNKILSKHIKYFDSWPHLHSLCKSDVLNAYNAIPKAMQEYASQERSRAIQECQTKLKEYHIEGVHYLCEQLEKLKKDS